MSPSNIARIRTSLVDRDIEVLKDVSRFRLLTTKHIQRLHFDTYHPTAVAAARACNRTLARLRELGLLKALDRRIGGARAGSAGYVWHVGYSGERLLQALNPNGRSKRSNFREPTHHFVDHTLAIADLAVQLIVASRHQQIEVLSIETEPSSWQQSLTALGVAQVLKPDLRLITATTDFEHHRFVEIDRATEHTPVILRQCAAYEAHRATGRYQADHGLYPTVWWVVPDENRRRQLTKAIGSAANLTPDLFHVLTATDFLAAITAEGGES